MISIASAHSRHIVSPTPLSAGFIHALRSIRYPSKQLWSADKPHPLWKFGETALWTLALLPGSCRMWTCLHGESLASFSHWTRLQYLKCSDVIELCNGTVFNLYLRLPRTQVHNSYTAWSGSNIALNKHFSGISDTTGTRDGITIPQLSISPILTLAVSILVLSFNMILSSHDWRGTFGSRRKKTVRWVRIKNHIPELLPTLAAVSPN